MNEARWARDIKIGDRLEITMRYTNLSPAVTATMEMGANKLGVRFLAAGKEVLLLIGRKLYSRPSICSMRSASKRFMGFVCKSAMIFNAW